MPENVYEPFAVLLRIMVTRFVRIRSDAFTQAYGKYANLYKCIICANFRQ